MECFSVKQHELRDLWVVVAIAVLFSLYVTMVSMAPRIEIFFERFGSGFPLATIVNNTLAVWLALLMWVAYRRWCRVIHREQELTDIFFSINPVVLMVVDSHGTIVTCNPAVKEVLDFDPPDLEGRPVSLLIPDLSQNRDDALEVKHALDAKGYSLAEMEGRKKDGTPIALEVITCDLKGRQGTISLITDITERVRADQALRAAKEEVEEANRVKSRLLAEAEKNLGQLQHLEELRDSLVHMIVHDMKSPLQVIMTSLDVLDPADITVSTPVGDKRDLLDIAKNDSKRLLAMITSLLDVSRFESGDMSLDVEVCDLKEVVETCLKSFLPLVKDRRVVQDIPEQALPLSCDAGMIQRVCCNLLDNALKYTAPGDEIVLTLAQIDSLLRVSVQDSGPGIAPEHYGLIFEKFGRVKNLDTPKSQPASGLGLAFCKLAVEAHGGEIGVESDRRRGSTFWFTLPAACPALISLDKAASSPPVSHTYPAK